jgi:hypothetical protein
VEGWGLGGGRTFRLLFSVSSVSRNSRLRKKEIRGRGQPHTVEVVAVCGGRAAYMAAALE